MKDLIQSLKPHLIAILAGFLLLFLYFPPVFLENKEIPMSDIHRSMATSKQTRDFREATGIEPLWTNSQFGGMPTFQMNTEYPNNLINDLEWIIKARIPSNLGLLFTMFLGFYFLAVFLGVRSWIAIISAFAFSFSTFFIVSLEAGHTGKLRAIGYMAPVLIGVLLTMKGRKLLGAALTCIFISLAINANHFQITYYLALMILVYILIEAYYHVKEKKIKAYLIKCAVLGIAALIAVGPNVSRLWTTIDYGKETMRGGKSELKEYRDAHAGGLEKDYATAWSYGIMETFTLLIPDFYGGSSTGSLKDDSHIADDLRKRGVPKNQIQNILEYLPLYWGDQTFTSGPVFLGAGIVFLFVLSLFVLRGRLKIWLLACTAFSIVLSWGSNFTAVTDLFFYYFPLYNKFRTPSMILTVASVTIPLMAAMGLSKVLNTSQSLQNYLPEIKKSFYITGGICLFFAIFGTGLFSFSGAGDERLPEGWPIDALIEDRKSLFAFSAFKSFLFIAACFALLWAFAKNKISPRYLIAGMALAIGLDIWIVDKKYLNDSDLTKFRGIDKFYVDSEADKVILQDKDPDYRVFNLSVNPFTDAMTSYHHKSVGGYHGAKLIRYQDMIDKHLGNNNPRVVDMLNTRYYIVRNKESGQLEARRNPSALGNAWFVDSIIWAKNADMEIQTLNTFHPEREVVIDERYKSEISDHLNISKIHNSIELTRYQPNQLVYEADVVNSNQFAVFSEIYYEGTDHDWKSSIDGQPVDHIRVNYILRGMEIPPGHHVIEFSFRPVSYFMGEKISLVMSIVVYIFLAIAISIEIRKVLKPEADTA